MRYINLHLHYITLVDLNVTAILITVRRSVGVKMC